MDGRTAFNWRPIGATLVLALSAGGGPAWAVSDPHRLQPITAPVLTPPDPALAMSLPLGWDDADRLTTPVMINGQGPYPFMVDTGADRTAIARELATQLGLKAGDPVRLNSTGGVDQVATARIDRLDAGHRRVDGLQAPTLLAADMGAVGILGIDSLRDQRVVMNFRAREMYVEPSAPEVYDRDVIVVRARSRMGRLVLVDAYIGRRPIFVILDSGAQYTIGNRAMQALAEGGAAASALRAEQVVSASGRRTVAYGAMLREVEIGGVRLENVPIAVADLHTFEEFDLNGQPALLLGMDVLRHFDRVAVDFGRRQVSFQVPAG